MNEYEVFEPDHGQAQAYRNERSDEQLPPVQPAGSPGRPCVHRQQHDDHDQPDVGRGERGGPATRATTSATSGSKDALTMGQVAASSPRM